MLPVLPARPTCERCSLHEGCISVGIPTVWDPGSLKPGKDVPAVVWVAASPSYVEDEKNAPLCGPVGAFFKHVYVDGIGARKLASCYYTTAVRCRTGLGDPPPKDTQLRACRHWLMTDLRSIAAVHGELNSLDGSPNIIVVAMGNPANKSLLNCSMRDAMRYVREPVALPVTKVVTVKRRPPTKTEQHQYQLFGGPNE